MDRRAARRGERAREALARARWAGRDERADRDAWPPLVLVILGRGNRR